ncbi:MAG: hypothetical protein KF678_03500 [Phycisphaeraceae bacterium]|nr:hypothetical protein [Phycisphaeraceae bacterium]
MKVKLLIEHPYLGGLGTIIEVSDKDGAGMIGNRIAAPLEEPRKEEPKIEPQKAPAPKAVPVSNKKLKEKSIESTTLAHPSDFDI